MVNYFPRNKFHGYHIGHSYGITSQHTSQNLVEMTDASTNYFPRNKFHGYHIGHSYGIASRHTSQNLVEMTDLLASEFYSLVFVVVFVYFYHFKIKNNL